jgi:hypothetical protein
MSNVTASTEASSTSRAFDLRDEIDKKLSQADGICTVICSMRDMADTPVSASLWGAPPGPPGACCAADWRARSVSRRWRAPEAYPGTHGALVHPNVTMDVYGHLMPQGGDQVADRLGVLVFGASGSKTVAAL